MRRTLPDFRPCRGPRLSGVVMLGYLKQALAEQRERVAAEARPLAEPGLAAAVIGGVLRRLRPLPSLFGAGTGSEGMRGTAAPLVGAMASPAVPTLAAPPAAFPILQRRALRLSRIAETSRATTLHSGEAAREDEWPIPRYVSRTRVSGAPSGS